MEDGLAGNKQFDTQGKDAYNRQQINSKERGNEMSKFKVGDEVMLSPESKWVDSRSDQPNSTTPTGVVGEIVREHADAHEEDTEFQWSVSWSNGTTNSYHSDDLLLVTGTSVRGEANLHDIIEEQEAHIENLEEALEIVQKELVELREGNSKEFKPISEMTMEDWYTAKAEGWVFADNKFSDPTVVKSIVNGEIYFDNYTYPFDIKGVHTEEPEEYQIIKRIE